jgi:hypothetical protein
MGRKSAKSVREDGFAKAEKYKKKDQPKNTGPRGTRLVSKRAAAHCRATKRTGGKCTMAAGWGTDHPGIGRCKWHGGCTPSHVKAAAQEEYRQLLGKPKEINPFEAIMWCIRIRAGEVEWLGQKMSELESKDWIEETLVGKQFHLYAKERQHAMSDLVRYSETAIRMGIAERYVRLAEVYGQTIAKLIEGILEDLNLTEEQKAIAPQAVRRQLLMIEGGSMIDNDAVVEATAKRKELPAKAAKAA